jgi:ABC-type cobalamin/Fe3+-siderophores transport system ATPase subunit
MQPNGESHTEDAPFGRPDLRRWPEAAGGDSKRVRFQIDRVWLVSGDSIEVPPTGVCVIVGANNSGKSTFLRQLNYSLQFNSSNMEHHVPQLIRNTELTRNTEVRDLLTWMTERSAFLDLPASHGGETFAMLNGRFQVLAVREGQFSQENIGLNDGLYPVAVNFADAQSRLNASFQGSARAEPGDAAADSLQMFQDERRLFKELSLLSESVFDKPLFLDDFPGATIRIRVGSVDLPVPTRLEPLGRYGTAVGRLPLLGEQGDGMRSFFGIMIPILTGAFQIVLLDEPEAFLHPPQARALGRELARNAKARGIQVIVATHDKDFIAGLLDAEAELTVVRLQRGAGETRRAQLSSKKLKQVWDDRALRYSNVLNGLFVRLVVICESEQDCRFYEAALDAYVAANANTGAYIIPASDVLFIPSNGKGGFASLIPVLKDLAVPTAVVPDLDFLRSEDLPKRVLSEFGANWEDFASDYRIATNPLRKPSKALKASTVLDAVQQVLGPVVLQDQNAVYDRDLGSTVSDLIKHYTDPWETAKRFGLSAFSGHSRDALDALITRMDEQGIVLVQVGELEGFHSRATKGKTWLPAALAAGAHQQAEATSLISRLLHYHSLSADNDAADAESKGSS